MDFNVAFCAIKSFLKNAENGHFLGVKDKLINRIICKFAQPVSRPLSFDLLE